MIKRNEHGIPVLDFGKHNGASLHHVPFDYLQWMANQEFRNGPEWAELAKAELDRRGVKTGGVMPSHHAIDRFSTRRLEMWSDRSIGISTTIKALAEQAWDEGKHGKKDHDGSVAVHWRDCKWVYLVGQDGNPHTLKTVIVKDK